MDVSVPQALGQLFVVPKISSQDRILQRTVEQISRCFGDTDRRTVGGCVDIVFQDRSQQRTLIQISDISVSQAVKELLEIFKVLSEGEHARSAREHGQSGEAQNHQEDGAEKNHHPRRINHVISKDPESRNGS